jgi:hypothetical protein
MEIENGNQILTSNFEIKIGFQILISVGIKTESRTEDELREEELDKVEAEANARHVAMTKFPSWVKLSYVRKVRDMVAFETIREMILSGMPMVEVGRQVHMLGEMPNIKLATVVTYLDHYRATIPTWMMAARQQPKQYLELKQKAEEGIDCLKEMSRLYNWIKERLEIGMAQERRFGILTSGMDRNFVVAAQLLQQIDEMKSKLGISDDQARVALPKHMSDQVEWNRIYSRESVQRVMTNPEQRSRVVQAAERLLDLWANKLTSEQLDKLKKSRVPEILPAEEDPTNSV